VSILLQWLLVVAFSSQTGCANLLKIGIGPKRMISCLNEMIVTYELGVSVDPPDCH